MDYRNVSENCKEPPEPCSDSNSLPPSGPGTNSCSSSLTGQRAGVALGRPAAANAARERSRVQTLRHAFLELQRTLPSVPPDTKLSKLDVLLLATTYIAHLTRSLQDEEELPRENLGTLRGDGYLHPVKVSCVEKKQGGSSHETKGECESFTESSSLGRTKNSYAQLCASQDG